MYWVLHTFTKLIKEIIVCYHIIIICIKYYFFVLCMIANRAALPWNGEPERLSVQFEPGSEWEKAPSLFLERSADSPLPFLLFFIKPKVDRCVQYTAGKQDFVSWRCSLNLLVNKLVVLRRYWTCWLHSVRDPNASIWTVSTQQSPEFVLFVSSFARYYKTVSWAAFMLS